MATKYYDALDLQQNELQNARLQNLGSDPGTPVEGQFWWRSDLNEWRVYDGSTVISLGSGLTQEQVEDIVGAMVAGNTETGIAVTYDDTGGKLNFAVDDEYISDLVGTMVTGNTETGIAVTYQDADNTLDFVVDFSTAVMDGDTAGGVLSGTYPNPGFASDMATQAELDAHINDTTDAHDASAISYSPSGDIAATDVQAAVLEALADAKAYADALAQGLKNHASVKAVALTPLDLTGAETIDGHSTATNDRILATAQADADENGIWLANNSGAWTRPTDFDAAAEVAEGAYVFVEEGTVYEGTGWVLAEVAGTFGSLTTQTWTQFSGAGEITAGQALTKTGNTLDVGVDGGTIAVTSDEIHIATGAAGNGLTGGGVDTPLAVGAGTGIIANANDVAIDTALVVRGANGTLTGGATSEVLTHNLGTRDVQVTIRNNASPWDRVEVTDEATSTNTVTIRSGAQNLPAGYTWLVTGIV